MPKFTGEASIYRSSGYYMGGMPFSSSSNIVPQFLLAVQGVRESLARSSLQTGLLDPYWVCYLNCMDRCGGDRWLCDEFCGDVICPWNPWVVFSRST